MRLRSSDTTKIQQIRLPLPGPHPEPGSRRAAAPCYTVATGGSDNLVKIWQLICFEAASATSAASGPTAGSRLRNCRKAAARQSEAALLLKGHSRAVMAVQFSPNAAHFLFRDHTVRIWKPETASSLHVVEAHARYVTSCCFSSDGRRLASGSNDRLVRVWDLAIEELPDSADTGQQEAADFPISTWTVDEVARLLDGLGLRELLPAFRRDRVDGSALLSLTDRRLRDQLG
uniref:SAM domain-containing protein n=1 Tax=Macrostomum lignano TaxID=282301 RepID=A0A1I8FBQ1_9PLAT